MIGKTKILLLLTAFLLEWINFAQTNAKIRFDCAILEDSITNKFSDINYFNIDRWVKYNEDRLENDYFLKTFPFIENVHLMAAVGGNDDRDLFKEPQNKDILDDYDFSRLILACKNIVSKGLTPMINLSAVPQKFSSDVKYGEFEVNVRPPNEYDNWYNYIKAIIIALKNEFGHEVIKTWMWEFGVEFEYEQWFDAGSPDKSQNAFMKIYDYGVSAIEDVVGNDIVVGTHAMVNGYSSWDELSLFEHVSKEKNFKTGKIGTQLDFFAISYYDRYPGTFNGLKFISTINTIKKRAKAAGLNNLKIGIDEGRIKKGWDNKPLTSRIVQHPIQAGADAKLFKIMIENDIDYFTSWGYGLAEGPVSISFNTQLLLSKMIGSKVVSQNSSIRELNDPNNEIDAMAAYSISSNSLFLFLYNNNNNIMTDSSENVSLKFYNIQDLNKNKETEVTYWIIDEQSSNWWNEWKKDVENLNLTSNDYDWSEYSTGMYQALITKEHKKTWLSNVKKYNEIAQLKPIKKNIEILNGTISLNITLKPHSFIFYEIKNVIPVNDNELIFD